MTGLFVGLMFGFCAAIANNSPNDVVWLGYRSGEECVLVLELTGDNRGSDSLVVQGHQINWEWLDGGVEIAIDEQKFVVMRFSAA
jgi:hypothetical protein